MERSLYHPLSVQYFGDDQSRCCAFAQLYDKCFNRVVPICYNRHQDDHLSSDILEGIFIGLWERSHGNAMLNIFTYLQKYKIVSLATGDTCYVAIQQVFPQYTGGVEVELRDVFEKVLASLPGKRKTIFLMFYGDEFTAKDIARMLDVPMMNGL